jgi:hypothetical protein
MDIHAMWSKFSAIYPWISIHEPAKALSGLTDEFPLWEDKNTLVTFWVGGVPTIRDRHNRKAKTALVYAEAIGDRNLMLPAHLEELNRLERAIDFEQYDATFAHTPWMREQLQKSSCPSFLFPLGWDEDVYGFPGFDYPKMHDYVYYGSAAGRRVTIIPFLKEKLGSKIYDITGTFGKLALSEIDLARANLYISHSSVESYSTWRIWQTLGTSAAIVSEPGDSWPLDPTRHMVLLEGPEWDNPDTRPELLRKILADVDLLAIAKLAHEEVALKYTCEYCVNEYLVPAGAILCGR